MITFSMCDLGELSAFVPPPPGDLLEAAQIEVVVAAQQNELPPMLTDLPPAGLKKVIARKPIKGNRSGPRKAPCCKTCGQPRKGHSRAKCVEVVLSEAETVSDSVENPCCAESAAGCAGCKCH